MAVFCKLCRIAQSSRVHKTVSVSVMSHAVGGSVFHKVGPETAKHRCPYLFVLERGTARSPCVAERR